MVTIVLVPRLLSVCKVINEPIVDINVIGNVLHEIDVIDESKSCEHCKGPYCQAQPKPQLQLQLEG